MTFVWRTSGYGHVAEMFVDMSVLNDNAQTPTITVPPPMYNFTEIYNSTTYSYFGFEKNRNNNIMNYNIFCYALNNNFTILSNDNNNNQSQESKLNEAYNQPSIPSDLNDPNVRPSDYLSTQSTDPYTFAMETRHRSDLLIVNVPIGRNKNEMVNIYPIKDSPLTSHQIFYGLGK